MEVGSEGDKMERSHTMPHCLWFWNKRGALKGDDFLRSHATVSVCAGAGDRGARGEEETTQAVQTYWGANGTSGHRDLSPPLSPVVVTVPRETMNRHQGKERERGSGTKTGDFRAGAVGLIPATRSNNS